MQLAAAWLRVPASRRLKKEAALLNRDKEKQ